MNIPVEYDDRVEFFKTNPALLPANVKNDLGASGINRSRTPSRSVLGDISNRNNPGTLRNKTTLRVPRNSVSWSEVVSQRG